VSVKDYYKLGQACGISSGNYDLLFTTLQANGQTLQRDKRPFRWLYRGDERWLRNPGRD